MAVDFVLAKREKHINFRRINGVLIDTFEND